MAGGTYPILATRGYVTSVTIFVPLGPDRANGNGRPSYTVRANPDQAEPDSDVAAVHARMVSVTPLSLDMTSRADFGALDEQLRA